jgi:hypothetical protein
MRVDRIEFAKIEETVAICIVFLDNSLHLLERKRNVQPMQELVELEQPNFASSTALQQPQTTLAPERSVLLRHACGTTHLIVDPLEVLSQRGLVVVASKHRNHVVPPRDLNARKLFWKVRENITEHLAGEYSEKGHLKREGRISGEHGCMFLPELPSSSEWEGT